MQYVFSALYGIAARKGIKLDDATLGIVGVGHVGSKVEAMARHLGFNVLMCDPPRAEAEGQDGFCSLEYLLANSQIVTLHVPLDETTRKMADEEFRRVFNVDIKGILDENPLPDTYDVTLSALSSDQELLEQFAEEARKIDGVEFVTYPQSFIEEMHSTLDILQFIMVVFGGALLVVAVILLNNTIRLAVYSQRELINTLKAVGATKWFIMRPFVGRSALQGFISGILALLLLGGTLYTLDHIMPGLGIFPRWEVLGFWAGAIILTGVVVAVICTLPVVSRFVNMKSNKIHLY
jgi:cell division transport system permease protein